MMAIAFLEPVEGSGVTAELSFQESLDGATLSVRGAGSGMDRLGRYRCRVDGDGVAGTSLGAWKGRLATPSGRNRTLRVVAPTCPPSGRHLYEIDTVAIHAGGTDRGPVVARGQVVRTP